MVWGGIDMKVKMFEKFRKIKKYVLSNPFLFFADFLLKASLKITLYTFMTDMYNLVCDGLGVYK